MSETALEEVRQLREDVRELKALMLAATKPYLNKADAARILGISKRTLERRATEQGFPSGELRNGRRTWLRHEIEALK